MDREKGYRKVGRKKGGMGSPSASVLSVQFVLL